jgi:hypothetical protein
MPARARLRVTAADRERRRLRIFARLQEGWSYEALAEAEALSRERIRQIVKASLDRREVDPNADFIRLQMARLDPALRLASEKVAEGDLMAIDRLLRVLDRMDKYQSAAACDVEDEHVDDEANEGFIDEEEEENRSEALRRQVEGIRRRVIDRLYGIPPAVSDRLDAAAKEKAADAARDGDAKFFQR